VECVRRVYTQRSDLYRKKLSGVALEESNLSPQVLKNIQMRLVELKFLSGTVDGMFGADTRAAIRSYQVSIGHVQGNFLNAQERSMLLGPHALREQTAVSTQSLPSTPERQPEVASAPLAVQILRNTDNRPREPDITNRAGDALAQQSAPNVANASTNGNRQLAGRVEVETHYLIEATLLAAAILTLTVVVAFMRQRQRIKLATNNVEVGGSPDGALNTDAPTNRSTRDKKVKLFMFASPASRDRKDTSSATGLKSQGAQVESPAVPEPLDELLARLVSGSKL
jgi:hypothetical protein